MTYELELLNHGIDDKTHVHDLVVQLVEVDANGQVIRRGEIYQTTYLLNGIASEFDFDRELTTVKDRLVERDQRVRQHKDNIKSLLAKHFRNKRNPNGTV